MRLGLRGRLAQLGLIRPLLAQLALQDQLAPKAQQAKLAVQQVLRALLELLVQVAPLLIGRRFMMIQIKRYQAFLQRKRLR